MVLYCMFQETTMSLFQNLTVSQPSDYPIPPTLESRLCSWRSLGLNYSLLCLFSYRVRPPVLFTKPPFSNPLTRALWNLVFLMSNTNLSNTTADGGRQCMQIKNVFNPLPSLIKLIVLIWVRGFSPPIVGINTFQDSLFRDGIQWIRQIHQPTLSLY